MNALAEPRGSARYELAGPDVMTHEEIVRLALRGSDKRRALLHVRRRCLARAAPGRAADGRRAFATWERPKLMEGLDAPGRARGRRATRRAPARWRRCSG